MIESIIPMTAGLLLDICGGYLIVQDFIQMIDRGTRTYHSFLDHVNKDQKSPDKIFDSLTQLQNKMIIFPNKIGSISVAYPEAWNMFYKQDTIKTIKFGFVFLSSGFILILIASWITYIETL